MMLPEEGFEARRGLDPFSSGRQRNARFALGRHHDARFVDHERKTRRGADPFNGPAES